MKSIENRTALVIDIFFCVVLMPVLIFLGPAHSWIDFSPIFVLIVCVWFYGCYFALKAIDLPRALITHRYGVPAAVILLLVAGNWLLTLYPLPKVDFVTPSMSEYQTRVRDYGIWLSLWLMFSLVAGYALTTAFVREVYAQLLAKRRAEAERDKAELAVFKAQISPHFLFNTLNSLYSLVIGTSQKAEDAFIKFTELLKYTYVTIGNETVPVGDEIAYIRNYIDLQEIRLNRHTRVEWSHDVDCESAQVPPMLMLTFVENAFKYGASTSEDCVIAISLVVREGELTFTTSNRVMKHADEFRTAVPVGIDNCRARLQAAFPGRHSLEAGEDPDGMFRVRMRIRL